MTNADWEELKEVVAEALEREPGERRAFVEAKLASREEMRREAWSLLAAVDEEPPPEEAAGGDGAGDGTEPGADAGIGVGGRLRRTGGTGGAGRVGGRSFVLDPRADAFLGLGVSDPEDLAGKVLGKYTLLRVIGRGGMGTVYLARQRDLDREVAVKVFPPHALGFDARLRFEREVQALSRVNHPGVARIYDAGLHADAHAPVLAPIPYFAMELVDGLPITEHVARHRLGLRERLALMAETADAVHAAHQRAIVHRDLKPGNVLVTPPEEARPWGAPKVLDFGIARMVREDARERTLWTGGILLGTLGYMAPEQARGEADEIDVRTDVYALGVILHEVVTGRPLHRLEGMPLTEALRRVSDPRPPAVCVPDDFTGGDLRNVLSVALAPEKERRYPSAAALAEDLRRLLRSDPVFARPATTVYRVRKFVRRHRGGVAAASLAAAGLLGGTVLASVGLVRERAARGRAESARAEAQEHAAIAQRQRRRAEASRDFLTHIVWSAEPGQIGRDVTVVDAVRSALPAIGAYAGGDPAAESDLRLTVAQTLRNLGHPEEADAEFAEAVRLAEEAFGVGSPQAVGPALERADMLTGLGRLDDGREIIERQARFVEAMPPGHERDQLEVALAVSRANLLGEEGAYAESAQAFREVLARVRAEPTLLDAYNLDTVRSHFGLSLLYAGELREAEAVQRALAADRAARLGPLHPRTLIVREHLAGTLVDLGEFDEARAILEEVIAEGSRAWGPTHPYTLSARHGLASLEGTRGNYAAAAELAGAILKDAEGVLPPDEPFLLFAANTRAVSLAAEKRWEEALPVLRDMVRRGTAIYGAEHPYTLSFRASLANGLGEMGDARAAMEELEGILEVQRRVLGDDAEPVLITRNNLAMFHLELGEPERAVPVLEEVLAAATAGERRAIGAIFRRNLGRALAGARRFEEAEGQLLLAHDEAREWLDESQVRRTAEFLAELYAAWGRAEAEAVWRGEAAGAAAE